MYPMSCPHVEGTPALLDRLRAFEKAGVTSALDFVPTADYQPLGQDVRDLEHISAVSRDGDGRSPWISRKVPRFHIGYVAIELLE